MVRACKRDSVSSLPELVNVSVFVVLSSLSELVNVFVSVILVVCQCM